MRIYEETAHEFVTAIKEIASKQDQLDNFESYLATHFGTWMKNWAKTPEGITEELKAFARMD